MNKNFKENTRSSETASAGTSEISENLASADSCVDTTANAAVTESSRPAKTKRTQKQQFLSPQDAQKKWGARKNQVFIFRSLNVPGGFHLLLCGDATMRAFYRIIFLFCRVGLIIADLPYNAAYKSDYRDSKKAKHKFNVIANDKLPRRSYNSLVRRILDNCRSVSLPGSAFFVFYGFTETINTYPIIVKSLGQLQRLLIWKKRRFIQSRTRHFRWRHEVCLFGHIDKKLRCWLGDRAQTTMFDEAAIATSPHELPRQIHPCPKPVSIIERFIKLTLEPGGVVLDPVSGGGSTLVAAEITGRIGIGIEIIPEFTSVICERMSLLGLEVIQTDLTHLAKVLAELGWGNHSTISDE